MERNPLSGLITWLTIVASILIIGGQIMSFFVNLNTLKEQRLKTKLASLNTGA